MANRWYDISKNGAIIHTGIDNRHEAIGMATEENADLVIVVDDFEPIDTIEIEKKIADPDADAYAGLIGDLDEIKNLAIEMQNYKRMADNPKEELEEDTQTILDLARTASIKLTAAMIKFKNQINHDADHTIYALMDIREKEQAEQE